MKLNYPPDTIEVFPLSRKSEVRIESQPVDDSGPPCLSIAIYSMPLGSDSLKRFGPPIVVKPNDIPAFVAAINRACEYFKY